jgi:hypothetical protein
MSSNRSLGELVELDRHPLDRPESPGFAASLAAARVGIEASGCAVVSGLVRAEAVAEMSAEIPYMSATTHYSTTEMNPYFSQPDASLPADHPVNVLIERSSGFIPRDSFRTDSAIAALWQAPELLGFLAAALDMPQIHPYADPLAGLTINVLDPGQQFPWHYDTNDFAVTVLLDDATGGGIFEYIPDIRSGADESYPAISLAQRDEHPDVISLELHPGDMQIFRGRNSLHRVTRVAPDSCSRYTAILAYTAEPEVIGRLERTHQLFGRVLPAHEEAERVRVRHDSLRD